MERWLGLLALLIATTAWAQDCGLFCFQTNFLDRLEVGLRCTRDPEQFDVTARWHAETLYRLGGAGHVDRQHPTEETPPPWAVHITFVNPEQAAFGGHPTCAMDAVFDPSTFTGAARMRCHGNPSNPFLAGVGLTLVDCADVSALAHQGVPDPRDAAGHPDNNQFR